MTKKLFTPMTIEQALEDIRSWLNNHALRSEKEMKNIALAKSIVDLYLDHHYVEDSDKSIENYDLNILYGYAFFLSQDSEFGYNRSFLNDKAKAYIEARKASRYLFGVIIAHFNIVCKSLDKELRPFRIQYNDLYVFTYDGQMKRWTASIKNGKIGNILKKSVIFQVCQDTGSISTNIVIYTKEIIDKGEDSECVSELKIILD